MIEYRLVFPILFNFELGLMVKRKYPCLIIISVILIIAFLLSPILRCIASKYPPTVCLNYYESRSLVETQIIPLLSSELVLTPSVDHLQLSQLILETFH